MRVQLIFPPNVEAIEPFKSAQRKPPLLLWGFPLGLGYLAAVLKGKGHVVSLIDACFEGSSMEAVLQKVEEFRPDIVGIGTLTHLARTAVALAEGVKAIDERITVLCGGPHATYDYEGLLKRPCIDYVVVGEGELTVVELCERIEARSSVDDVKGIAFRAPNGDIVKTPHRPLIRDLDSLPYPARDMVDFERYIKSYGVLEKSIDVMASRGCTNRCAFCSSSHLFGAWRTRSTSNIIEEIEHLVTTYPEIQSINFMDDDFTAQRQRVIELCGRMRDTGLHRYKWVCLARVDQLDDEVARALKEGGCIRVHLGIESGSEEVLKAINKRISLAQARTAVRLLTKYGIEAYSFFMIGNPGETNETIAASASLAKELRSANTGFFITQVFPGTRLAQLQPVTDWLGFLYEPEVKQPSIFTHPCIPVFLPEGFSRESLKRICGSITRRFVLLHFLRRAPLFIRKFLAEPRASVRYLLSVFCNRT